MIYIGVVFPLSNDIAINEDVRIRNRMLLKRGNPILCHSIRNKIRFYPNTRCGIVQDVLIIGAGPSGAYLGHLLSSRGFRVKILEEHKEVGRPVECTGLVSERVFRMARSASTVNTVSGANVHFPNGKSIHIEKGEKTIVMDRDVFDKDVAAMAISSGADLRINSRAISVKTSGDSATVTYRENGTKKEEKCAMVIGADGINSVVRRDLFAVRPGRIISCYQVDSAVKLEDQDSVNVFIGSESSKGFFGWATPSDKLTRIGVGSYHSPAIKHFLKVNQRYGSNRILGINGGSIPVRYLDRTYGNRTLLVGDAAGIVKPLSGGGIFTGMVSARHAADAAEIALSNEDVSSRGLSRYQKSWKRELGRELWFDGIVHRLFGGISDKKFNAIYDILSDDESIRIINTRGDIDFPSKVIFSLFARKPSLLGHFLFSR